MDSLVNDLVSHYKIGRFRISALPVVYGKALRFYSKNYEARRFDRNHMVMIVNVPVEDLKNAVMKSALAKGFSSFNDYHEDYKKTHIIRDYDEIYPIIIGDLFGCVIEDGWNRFHGYVESGLTLVPCIYEGGV